MVEAFHAADAAQHQKATQRILLSSIGKMDLSGIPKLTECKVSLDLGITGVGEPSASVNVKARLLGLELLDTSKNRKVETRLWDTERKAAR